MAKQKLPDKNFEWTPELAYAVGLLVTDGNLAKDGRHIVFRSCDIDQIETLRTCLDAKNSIEAPRDQTQYGKRTCYRIQIGNVQLYRWLLSIGLFPAKTYTIGPISVPDEFFRDFIRGHLDGDGSITFYYDRYNTFKNPAYVYARLHTCFISASMAHIEWIRAMLRRLLEIKGDLFEKRPSPGRRGVSIWQLKYMKQESIKLLNWLYYDPHIPYLERKRKKAITALTTINAIKRKQYVKRII